MQRIFVPILVAMLMTVALPAAHTTRSAPTSRPHKLSLQRLWVQNIRPNADSVPAYAAHPCDTTNRCSSSAMIYVLGGNNTSNCNPGDPVKRAVLYALDAKSGAIRWTRSTGGASRCTTASVVIDARGQWVYTPGLDGRIHRYNALTGGESHGNGWPITVTLMPDVEKIAANPTIGGHYLYVTTSGFIGDAGHYQGHLVTIDLRTGRSHVFNSLCSNIRTLLGNDSSRPNYCRAERSGLFGRGQGAVDPVTHNVFITSGNGPWNGRTHWGDSLLELNASGQRLLDAYTPPNQASLESADQDLGSTGPAILPTLHANRHAYHFLVQGGKGPSCNSCGGVALHLLNRDNLSGQGGPGHLGGDIQTIQSPGGCEVLTAPAVQSRAGVPWVFYANGCGIAGYRLSSPSARVFRLERKWSVSSGGSTPVLGNGFLFVARKGEIAAYSPGTGSLLWHGSIGDVHWEYPLIAGKVVYVPDENGHVSAFKIR